MSKAERWRIVNLKRGYVIERYEYVRDSGSKGFQWCVHEVRDPGVWHQLAMFDTRREAAEYLAAHLGVRERTAAA